METFGQVLLNAIFLKMDSLLCLVLLRGESVVVHSGFRMRIVITGDRAFAGMRVAIVLVPVRVALSVEHLRSLHTGVKVHRGAFLEKSLRALQF